MSIKLIMFIYDIYFFRYHYSVALRVILSSCLNFFLIFFWGGGWVYVHLYEKRNHLMKNLNCIENLASNIIDI